MKLWAVFCLFYVSFAEEDTNNDINAKVDILIRQIDKQNKQIEKLNQKVEILEKKDSSFVGFSAYCNSDKDTEGWGRVIYESVTINVGDAYNSADGIFTCPVSGYYYFSVAAGSNELFNFAQLMVGDTSYGAALGDSANADQGMVGLVAQCDKDTQVWVRNARDNSENFCGKKEDVLINGFNGFLISLAF